MMDCQSCVIVVCKAGSKELRLWITRPDHVDSGPSFGVTLTMNTGEYLLHHLAGRLVEEALPVN